MSDSARFDLGLSARTILIGCSLAQSRGGSAAVVVARRGNTPALAPPPCDGARFPDAREPSFHSRSGLKAELGHAARVVLHES
jgi:hypothetical protein